MIAHYTQALIDALVRDGKASLWYAGKADRQRMRSRLHNAASRAGLKITTQDESDSQWPPSGHIVATVTGRTR